MILLAPAIPAATRPALEGMKKKIRANKIPVLQLIDEVDPLMAGDDRFRGVLPHLKVVMIPGANHVDAFRDPLFLSSLKSFLAEHPKQHAKAQATGK